MIKAIIFDLDGVLIESEIYFFKAEIEILKWHGVKNAEDIVGNYLGIKLDRFLNIVEGLSGKALNHQQITQEIEAAVKKVYKNKVPLVPHVSEILPKLAKSYKLVLATSREEYLAKMIMQRLKIDRYFKNGVYQEHVTLGKPDPEVYISAAKLIGVPPEDCAAIEDAEAGFQASKKAGMFVIGRRADHNKHQDFSLADTTFQDFTEIPDILASRT